MHKLRRVVVLLAVVASACSSGGGGNGEGGSEALPTDPQAALAAAARETGDAKSVKMALTIGSDESVKLGTGEGAFDFENQLGRFKLSTTLGVNFDLILTEERLYVKNPDTTPGSKPWVSLAQGDTSLGMLSQLRGQIDPREALKGLGTSIRGARKIGTQKVRGVDTTRFRGQVDLSDEAIAEAPEDAREGLRAAQKQFGPQGYQVDAWIDDDALIRRFQYALGVNTGATPGPATTVTMDLYGYGDDPEITVPKPEDVEERAAPTATTAAP